MDARTQHPLVEAQALFERFPHLRRVELLWGSPECRKLLIGLMMDDRDGTRAGFPPAYATLIMRLVDEHDRQFPNMDENRPTGGWTDPENIRNRWR